MAKKNGRSGSFGPAPEKASEGLLPRAPETRSPAKMPLGVFGSLKQPPAYTLFGEPEEIEDREATGYRLGGTPPETAVPAFQQIRPGPTEKDANRPEPVDMRGDSKFGNPRRYH